MQQITKSSKVGATLRHGQHMVYERTGQISLIQAKGRRILTHTHTRSAGSRHTRKMLVCIHIHAWDLQQADIYTTIRDHTKIQGMRLCLKAFRCTILVCSRLAHSYNSRKAETAFYRIQSIVLNRIKGKRQTSKSSLEHQQPSR